MRTRLPRRWSVAAGRGRQLVWVVGTAAAVTLGFVGGGAGDTPLLADRLGLESRHGPWAGVLLLHPDDCESAWRFLDLVARPKIRAQLPVVSIVTTESPHSPRWRGRLPQTLRSTPWRTLTRAAARVLGPLGLRGTPALLIFEGRRLVAIERAPTDAVAFVELGRRLERYGRAGRAGPSQ